MSKILNGVEGINRATHGITLKASRTIEHSIFLGRFKVMTFPPVFQNSRCIARVLQGHGHHQQTSRRTEKSTIGPHSVAPRPATQRH